MRTAYYWQVSGNILVIEDNTAHGSQGMFIENGTLVAGAGDTVCGGTNVTDNILRARNNTTPLIIGYNSTAKNSSHNVMLAYA